MLPDEQAILKPIYLRVFRKALVEAAHWSQENDRIDVVEVGGPFVSLSPVHVTLVR